MYAVLLSDDHGVVAASQQCSICVSVRLLSMDCVRLLLCASSGHQKNANEFMLQVNHYNIIKLGARKYTLRVNVLTSLSVWEGGGRLSLLMHFSFWKCSCRCKFIFRLFFSFSSSVFFSYIHSVLHLFQPYTLTCPKCNVQLNISVA